MSTEQAPTSMYYQVQAPLLPVDEADAALVSVNPNLPYDQALSDFVIPKTLLQYYPDHGECDFASVTHFALKAYYIEQAKILARVGVRYNWDFPFVFWHFLGRIVSEVFLGTQDQLCLINASVAGDREFVSFATRHYVDGCSTSSHHTRIIEVHLGWEDGHNPLADQLRAFWRPARRNIIANINWSISQQMAAPPHIDTPRGERAEDAKEVEGFDTCAEALLSLQNTEQVPNAIIRERIMVVGGGRMYYSVYFSPHEYRLIAIEDSMS